MTRVLTRMGTDSFYFQLGRFIIWRKVFISKGQVKQQQDCLNYTVSGEQHHLHCSKAALMMKSSGDFIALDQYSNLLMLKNHDRGLWLKCVFNDLIHHNVLIELLYSRQLTAIFFKPYCKTLLIFLNVCCKNVKSQIYLLGFLQLVQLLRVWLWCKL